MRKIVVGGLIALALVSGWPTARALAALPNVAQRKITPDPCGYRYAAWSVVQGAANLVDQDFADEYSANLQANYLEFKSIGLRRDYGNPTGAEDIQLILQGAMDSAAETTSLIDSGAAPYDIGIARSAAQDGQRRLWQTINGMCRSHGKAHTWTGWQSDYGYQSHSTASFHVPAGWSLKWQFQCPPSQYGGTDVRSGNFIVNLRGGPYGSLGLPVVNELDTSGDGGRRFSRGGTYSFQVISGCAWHVQATR